MSSFGPEFEKDVARLAVTDPGFIPSVCDRLKDADFVEESVHVIMTSLLRGFEKHRCHLGIRFLEETSIEVPDWLLEPITVPDTFINEKVYDYLETREVEEAILSAASLVQSGKISEARQIFREASVERGHGDANSVYDFFSSTVDRIKGYGKGEASIAIPTGIPVLDAQLDNGGLSSGELGLIQAPPGSGKSSMLINIGYGAIAAGFKVLHFSLEMSEIKVARRYDMRICGMSKEDLESMKKSAYLEIKRLMAESTSGLVIKGYSCRTANSTHLNSYIRNLANRGFKPDLVLVDYGEIMAPERKLSDRYLEIDESYEMLRSLGQEWCCPVWSGSQTNKSAIGEKTSDMRHTGGSFGKMKTADVVLTLNIDPRMRDDVPLRIFCAKNREEKSGWEVDCEFHRSKQTILAQ